MKVNIYETITNECKLKRTNEEIQIKSGRWEGRGCCHPMEYNKKYYSGRKHSYYLFLFGDRSNPGIFINLNWQQNQWFLLSQRKHWIQKEENIRYLINLLFLSTGIWLASKK